jgi:hypothetical protein
LVGNPTCHRCSRKIVIGYSVKDELWAKLPDPWFEGSVLCLECFIEEIDSAHPTQKITLNDFYYLSFIGDFDHDDFGGIILDSDYRRDRRIYLGD